MDNILEMAFMLLVITSIVLIIIYIILGIYLNKLNYILYGKKTPMAWIPIVNIYLLGKLTFNKIVGWILIGCMFLQSETTVTINGVSKTSSFLPENIKEPFSKVFSIVCVLLIIYSIIKYYKLKGMNTNTNINNNYDIQNSQPITNVADKQKEIYNNQNDELQQNVINNDTVNTQSTMDSNVNIEKETFDPNNWEFMQDKASVHNNTTTENVEIIDDNDVN